VVTNYKELAIMKINVDIETVMSAIEDGDMIGFCIACGEEASGCEPDARKYTCESCGAKKVYGAEEILMMIA
jgi:hypothetical protein